jgi:hypothetical protein
VDNSKETAMLPPTKTSSESEQRRKQKEPPSNEEDHAGNSSASAKQQRPTIMTEEEDNNNAGYWSGGVRYSDASREPIVGLYSEDEKRKIAFILALAKTLNHRLFQSR